MAVAHDASSESHTGTTGSVSEASFSWTHTPSGTPRAALVWVYTNDVSQLETSVTYGGNAMSAVTGGAAEDTANETGSVQAYFLDDVPSGAQTVIVNRTNNGTAMYAVAVTVTAASACEIYEAGIVILEENQALTEQSVDDGSPGTDSVRYAFTHTGDASGAFAGANSTDLHGIAFGGEGANAVRETTAGQGSRSVGFSLGADDVAAVHLAIRETPAGGGGAISATLSFGAEVVGEITNVYDFIVAELTYLMDTAVDNFTVYVTKTVELTTNIFTSIASVQASLPAAINATLSWGAQTSIEAATVLQRIDDALLEWSVTLETQASGVPLLAASGIELIRKGLGFIRRGVDYIGDSLNDIIRRY